MIPLNGLPPLLKRLIRLMSLLAAVFFVTPAFAQTSEELRRQQAEIQKEIDELRETLQATQKNKKVSLGQLALVQRRLRLRENAIGNINSQIDRIETTINRSRSDIYKLRKELDTLRSQYAKSVIYAYKNRSNYDFLNFIFSASSFNEAFKRVEYLRAYRTYRQQQSENIRKTQLVLKQKISGLELNRKEKDLVLKEQEKERKILQEERNEKNEVVMKLKSRELSLIHI